MPTATTIGVLRGAVQQYDFTFGWYGHWEDDAFERSPFRCGTMECVDGCRYAGDGGAVVDDDRVGTAGSNWSGSPLARAFLSLNRRLLNAKCMQRCV